MTLKNKRLLIKYRGQDKLTPKGRMFYSTYVVFGEYTIESRHDPDHDSMILRELTDKTYCEKTFVPYSRARYEYFTNRLNITKFKIIRPINQSKFYKSKRIVF
jgi:hypothetical protein